MRSTLLMLILLLPVLALINALWFAGELRRFLEEVPRLQSTYDLERFKRVVARQMYAALVQIVLLSGPVIMLLFGVVAGALSVRDIGYVLVPALIVLGVAWTQKDVERRARTIPAVDELTESRDAVVETWFKKPVPDW